VATQLTGADVLNARHGDTRYRIAATITRFVNSKVHAMVNERERLVRLDAGSFRSSAMNLILDEGSELQLQVALHETKDA
jgi:hypothetical protein